MILNQMTSMCMVCIYLPAVGIAAKPLALILSVIVMTELSVEGLFGSLPSFTVIELT